MSRRLYCLIELQDTTIEYLWQKDGISNIGSHSAKFRIACV